MNKNINEKVFKKIITNICKEVKEKECLFFGCYKVPGHFVYAPKNRSVSKGIWHWVSQLDGRLTPPSDKDQSKALLYHIDNITIIAFWDYTGDQRPGSNSMFIISGIHHYAAAISIARKHFKEIFDRLTCQIDFILCPRCESDHVERVLSNAKKCWSCGVIFNDQ